MNVKITEIEVSREQTRQFVQFEPLDFRVSAKATIDENEDRDKAYAELSQIVQKELGKEIREKELEMSAKVNMSVDERLGKTKPPYGK